VSTMLWRDSVVERLCCEKSVKTCLIQEECPRWFVSGKVATKSDFDLFREKCPHLFDSRKVSTRVSRNLSLFREKKCAHIVSRDLVLF